MTPAEQRLADAEAVRTVADHRYQVVKKAWQEIDRVRVDAWAAKQSADKHYQEVKVAWQKNHRERFDIYAAWNIADKEYKAAKNDLRADAKETGAKETK